MKKNNGTTETPASVICDGEQQVGACPVVSPLRQVTNPVGSTYCTRLFAVAAEMRDTAPICDPDWADQLTDWADRIEQSLSARASAGEGGPVGWLITWNDGSQKLSFDRCHEDDGSCVPVCTAAPQPAQADASGGGDGRLTACIEGIALAKMALMAGDPVKAHERLNAISDKLDTFTTPASPATGQVAAGCAHVWVPGQAGMMYCDQCGRQKPAATPQPAAAQEDARATFKSHFPQFDLTEKSDDWGRPKFIHEHVESIFYGWKERASLAAAPQPQEAPVQDNYWHLRGYAYASKQATNCAGCGEHKHTPLRIDWMGGYVCLTCINKELEMIFPTGPNNCQHPRATVTIGPTTDQRNHHCPDCHGFWTTWPTRLTAAAIPLATPPAHGDGEDIGCLREQSAAWFAVVAALDEVMPEWREIGGDVGRGMDRAAAAIRTLTTRPTPEAQEARDAARYRHMRDRNNSLERFQRDKDNGTSCYHVVGGVRELKSGDELDAAIDAAIELRAHGGMGHG